MSLALLGAQGLPGDEANVITMLLRTAGGKQMPTSPIALIKRVTLNVRIKSEDRDLIDRAARARGKNRTDFILDATRAAAEETLLDQVLVAASPQAYAAFLARLDMPPQSNGRLRETMQTKGPWEPS